MFFSDSCGWAASLISERLGSSLMIDELFMYTFDCCAFRVLFFYLELEGFSEILDSCFWVISGLVTLRELELFMELDFLLGPTTSALKSDYVHFGCSLPESRVVHPL